jgi:hypothetical protein
MSAVATKAISAKLFTGTFDLRCHLVDHTTEEIADDIVRAANETCEMYRAHTLRKQAFTALFAFGGVVGDPSKIELYVMAPGTPNVQAGVIALKWKKIGNQEILVLRKQPRLQHMEHMNAHFNLADLKTALSIRQVSLIDERNDLLAHSLVYFEAMNNKHPASFTFDLEFNDEAVTIVAYRDFKRHSAITAFV